MQQGEMFSVGNMQLDSVEGYEPGQQINWGEIFKVGDKVDVAGTTNGKGFQGEGEWAPFHACAGTKAARRAPGDANFVSPLNSMARQGDL